ncbi:MAG: hypothetical protein NUK62_04055 [Tenericutes bacterium]|nr:hypothetical protein [Mycoplasmatota bacterium]
MKFLFKIFVLPILLMLAVPAIFLALLYKSVDIPVDDFQDIGEGVSLTSMVQEEMDAFLLSNDSESTVGVGIAQSNANALLKAQFTEINANYLDDNATDDEKNYVMKEEYYGYQGSWVRFDEDIIAIESGLHVFVSNFTYKTRVLIEFKITADTDEVVLKLENLTVGNLPLAWVFSTVSWASEQITGQDIKGIIDEQLNGLATFDPQEREIRIDVKNLVEQQVSDPQQAAMIKSLMAFIEENELLDIGFSEEEFKASLALGKTKDDTAPFVLNTMDKIIDDVHLQAILASKANALILSSLTTTTNPFIELDAFTLNRMFEYFLRDQQVSSGVIQEIELFENYKMSALVPYVTMTDVFTINIPLIIEDIGDNTKRFQTIIKIDAAPEMDGNDLKINLNALTAGEVTLSEEHIGNILTMLGDNEMIKDGAFVFENFDEQMNAAGMSIESVAMVNSKLRIYVDLNDLIPLEDIQDAVEQVLDTIVDNPEYSPELNDAINDVINNLNDPEGDPEQAVEDFLETLDDLSDEEQQALFDDLVEAFEGTDLDYEDIFGINP